MLQLRTTIVEKSIVMMYFHMGMSLITIVTLMSIMMHHMITEPMIIGMVKSSMKTTTVVRSTAMMFFHMEMSSTTIVTQMSIMMHHMTIEHTMPGMVMRLDAILVRMILIEHATIRCAALEIKVMPPLTSKATTILNFLLKRNKIEFGVRSQKIANVVAGYK